MSAPRAPIGCQWATHAPPGPVVQFLDPTFRVNVAEPRSLRTKYSLSELINVIAVINVIPGNGPNRAGPELGSTRTGGQDDGSLHKLPQTRTFY